MKEAIESMSMNPAVRVREIDIALQNNFQDAVFTSRDVENFRAELLLKKLDGYTPTQALVKSFDDLGLEHAVRFCEDEPNRILSLFWTYPWCITQWRRFPAVLQMDNTYGTNLYKMPLFQVTVITNVSSIANIGFGIVDNEREEAFYWLVQQVDATHGHASVNSNTRPSSQAPPSANNTRRVSKTATRHQSQWEADSVGDIDGQPVAGTKKRKAASRAAASRKTSRTTASRAPAPSTGMPPPSTAPPRLQETQSQEIRNQIVVDTSRWVVLDDDSEDELSQAVMEDLTQEE